jgi:hypothetical protein
MKVLTQASLLYSYIYILSRQNIYTDTLYGHIKNEVLVKGELMSAISWRSVLLVEETGVPKYIHRPVTSQ